MFRGGAICQLVPFSSRTRVCFVYCAGDHPKTAEAIARKINLIIGETRESLAKKTGRPIETVYDDEVEAVVVHGDDIDGLQGWQWDQIFAKQEIVFARTSPTHKLEIGEWQSLVVPHIF